MPRAERKVTLIWDKTNLFDSALQSAWEVNLLEDIIARVKATQRFPWSKPTIDNDSPRWEKEPAFFEELLTENAVQALPVVNAVCLRGWRNGRNYAFSFVPMSNESRSCSAAIGSIGCLFPVACGR